MKQFNFKKFMCGISYLFTIGFLLPPVLSLFYIISLFYLYSNPYVQVEISFKSILVHLLADFIAVCLVKWTFILWNKWCNKGLNVWLQLFGLVELCIYFFMISMNGFFDRLEITNWYIKPGMICVELVLLFWYFIIEVKSYWGNRSEKVKGNNER